MIYTIELTEAEVKAMETIARDVQEWIENATKNRARIAMDEIYESEIARMTADSTITSIPANKEQVILNASVQTVLEKEAEYLAEQETMEA